MPLTLDPVDDLVTDNDDPVDNTYSEQEQRLLPDSAYNSWTPPALPGLPGKRDFWVASDVGIFSNRADPPLVPDTFVILDYLRPRERQGAFFCWQVGRVPDFVLEIVSNRKGGELTAKLDAYARLGIQYYAIHDAERLLSDDELQAFTLEDGKYRPLDVPFFPELGLGLTLWEGEYEGTWQTWVRWCDESGAILATGKENAEAARAEAAEARAEAAIANAKAADASTKAAEANTKVAEATAKAKQADTKAAEANAKAVEATVRAEAAEALADAERAERERLAGLLRAMGIDPLG